MKSRETESKGSHRRVPAENVRDEPEVRSSCILSLPIEHRPERLRSEFLVRPEKYENRDRLKEKYLSGSKLVVGDDGTQRRFWELAQAFRVQSFSAIGLDQFQTLVSELLFVKQLSLGKHHASIPCGKRFLQELDTGDPQSGDFVFLCSIQCLHRYGPKERAREDVLMSQGKEKKLQADHIPLSGVRSVLAV